MLTLLAQSSRSRCGTRRCRSRCASCRTIWRRWIACWPIRAMLVLIAERFRREVIEDKSGGVDAMGRPTIAMETYVRLMVLKQRYRWGYRSLVAEVSDSIHLRRFCRISLSERVPDESTVRKLTRRIGRGHGQRAHARVDRAGDAVEALPSKGGADRLHSDRGGREVPDRRGLGGAWGQTYISE